MASASIAAYGYSAEETESAYESARQLLDDVAADSRQFAVLYGLCVVRWNLGRFPDAVEVARDLLARATKFDDPVPLSVGHRTLAMTYNVMGQFATAHEHAVKAVDFHDPVAHRESAFQYGHDIGVAAMWHQALAEWFLGRQDRAAEMADRASAHARELGYAVTVAYDHIWRAFFDLSRRDYDGLEKTTEALVRLSDERGLPSYSAMGRCYLGAALAAKGQAQEGIELMHEGEAQNERVRFRALRPTLLCAEANALAQLGRWDAALEVINKGLGLVGQTGERWWEPELLRTRSEIEREREAEPSVVAASLRRAIEVAAGQGSKVLELRSAIALARLWNDQGKADEAFNLLAPVYDWFTEGFDTPDLKGAKALLDRLV
jgi:tetratricopeptide (TPR) repeat protein